MPSLDLREILTKKDSALDGAAIFSTEDNKSSIIIGESGIRLFYRNQTINLTEENISIAGNNLNINVPIENIMFNGVYQMNPDLGLGLPSTIATPIPVFKIKPQNVIKPIFDKLKSISSVIAGSK